MYSFLRRPEDTEVENYFRNPENIKHLVSFLRNIDALAFFSEILHEYVNSDEELKRAIYSSDSFRNAVIKEKVSKFKDIVDEAMGLLELGNLRAFAEANYLAYVEAKQSKPKVGPIKLVTEMRDEEVKTALGFLLLLMKNVGRMIEGDK